MQYVATVLSKNRGWEDIWKHLILLALHLRQLKFFLAETIAKVLSGIDFPKSKDGIKKYARNNLDNFGTKGQRQQKPEAVLDLLDRIPEKQYSNMAEVEREDSKGIVISFFLYCYFRFW